MPLYQVNFCHNGKDIADSRLVLADSPEAVKRIYSGRDGYTHIEPGHLTDSQAQQLAESLSLLVNLNGGLLA